MREIARNHGLRATFMAKPFPGVSGNGLHLHHSLTTDGENVFAQGSDDRPLGNASMRHWVAGLATHAAQLALLANPTVNAYKRIEDYSFAPTRVSWGLDNRNVAVRCIPQVGAASRVEYRGGAADANPYLLAAGVLAAGMDGVERELELPPAAEHDAYADERLPLLPRSLARRDRGLGGDAVRARDVRRALRRRLRGPRPLRRGALRRGHHRLGDAALPGVRIASWQRAHLHDRQ